MDATSGGSNGHSPPLVMIRQGIAMHNPEDRRSMIELSRQTLWEPNQQRLYRVPGSVEQLNPATAPSQSTFSPSLQPPVYQAHAGNRHSYSGGPVLLPQYGLISEDQLGKSQFGGLTSPQFPQRRLVSSQRSFDSSSTGGINQCGRRGPPNTRTLVLSAVNEDDMSSSAHRIYGDVVDQGPDMTDSISSSPREGSGGGGSTPQLTPKHSARGSGQHAQQMYPVPGQLLVDPATGQHFIVPSQGGAAPAPQPIYYQPMYYPSPHGAPVQPAPAPHQFYGYAPLQGYPMAPLPQFSSRFAVPSYSPSMGGGRQQYQQAACSTDEMTRVGDDRLSSPKAPGSPHFGKGVTSFAAGYHQSRRDETDGRPSPPSSQPEDPEGPRDPFRRDVTRSSTEYRQMMSSMDINAAQSARFGGGPPQGMMVAPGSAPVLPQTDQSAPVWWASPSSRPRQGKGSFSGESTSYTDTESSSYVRRVTPPTLSSTTVSDSESSRPAPSNPYFQQQSPAAPTSFAEQATMNGQDSSPPMPKPKAIRMEIDLNKPMPEEEELRRAKEEKNKAKASRAPPTAFTVSFGDEGGEGEERGGPGKGRGMTLQDAARRGRMARRSVGGGTPSAPTRGGSTSSARPSTGSSPLVRQNSGDDKGFLLERLLHGDKARPATADPSPSSSSSSGVHSMGRSSQKDTDNNSDAGTYVIGQSEGRQHSTMITSQIIERDSDASSSDTETTVSRSPSPVTRRARPLAPSSSHPSSTPSLPSPAAASNENTSRMLLTELAKLKAMGGAALTSPRGGTSTVGSTASGSTPKARQTLMSSMPNRSVFGMAASSAGLTAPRPSALPPPSPSATTTASERQHQPPIHSPQPVSNATGGGNFRKSKYRCQSETRADGGRFSMRSTSGVNGGVTVGSAGGSPQTAPKRPPFKVGGGRPLLQSGNVAAEKQRENEMTAWLRRKDYNPMKAAMEAKKAQAAKNRSDQFVNNRSISFHVGNNGQHKPPPRGAELVRNKSSESLHATAEDEARSHASQRVIAEYSRGVVEDINKLTRQHSKTKDQKALSGLAKVVDQLSTKCKKSIELIRAQNKGCLSVSVEDLLATAVEPPRDDESLTDQLDRLSNAFDAVQRYLEQYSLDDKDLSSSEGEEVQSGFSASGRRGGPPSTFSSFSAYRQPRGGQQTTAGNRSTFTSINARPGRATNAYRAKLMGGHRSPSGGRPSKNN
ncbi:hypothetical protein PRIPAC_73262 [Pristionchus pacificus]|nr:hypothetical protein PRIPAC_73262 [Pristionchus pacificus]